MTATEQNRDNTGDGSTNEKPRNLERRRFLKGAATGAVAAAMVPFEPLIAGKASMASASSIDYNANSRAHASLKYRENAARDEHIDVGVQPDNGDLARFTDFSGVYSKALLHDGLGVPNASSFQSFQRALKSGKFADFEEIINGTPGGGPNSRHNGPQTAFALSLEGLDSHATVIPACPSVTSAATAAEMVEHYWGAILRDVPFSEYPTNPLVAQAVADMNRLSFLRSAENNEYPFPITPQNLFRGQSIRGDANLKGPYISQFILQPTFFGAERMDHKFQTFLPLEGGGSEFMTSVSEFHTVQNGGESGRRLVLDPTARHIRCGRDLSAYTHVDVLHESYFVAFMTMTGLGIPLNPGNPYRTSRTQKPFATLDANDAVATISALATDALKAAWFHKWIQNLRMRPEEYGGLVQARLTNSTPFPQAAAALHADVLNSAALPIIHENFGSFLLPQAFPEGSPTHPCYPTGHGSVGGACLTALKFFFDCNQKIRPLLLAAGQDVVEPSSDGLSLNTYTGADRDELDVNGELLKLGWNISLGHGIHTGIHFRSSSFQSLQLGEEVALSVLRDRARGYNEPFTINITKFDGTTATITNQNGTRDHSGNDSE
jgi:hypothetical protein